MNQKIEVPCSMCGKEAQTSIGCLYIGKGPFDPESKPVCKSCHDFWQYQKQNRILDFVMTPGDGTNSCTCKECGGLVSVGFAGKHASDVHKIKRYQFVKQ